MNYELCRKLKDAGFPKHRCPDITEGEIICGMCEGGMNPTLSELIEACGEGFETLIKNGTYFVCVKYTNSPDIPDIMSLGKTPREAVAKLWLVLNKK